MNYINFDIIDKVKGRRDPVTKFGDASLICL